MACSHQSITEVPDDLVDVLRLCRNSRCSLREGGSESSQVGIIRTFILSVSVYRQRTGSRLPTKMMILKSRTQILESVARPGKRIDRLVGISSNVFTLRCVSFMLAAAIGMA